MLLTRAPKFLEGGGFKARLLPDLLPVWYMVPLIRPIRYCHTETKTPRTRGICLYKSLACFQAYSCSKPESSRCFENSVRYCTPIRSSMRRPSASSALMILLQIDY